MMHRAKDLIDRVVGNLLIVLMGGSVVNVLWQVFSRFVLSAPSSFTQEVARFLLIWIGVLGAGYAVGKHDHLALEIVPEKMEGRAGEWLQIAIQTFVILFAVAVLIVGGIRLVYVQLTLGQTSASLEIPFGYVYSVLPLSGIVMTFYALFFIREHLRTLQADTPASSPDSRTPDQSTEE